MEGRAIVENVKTLWNCIGLGSREPLEIELQTAIGLHSSIFIFPQGLPSPVIISVLQFSPSDF